MNILSKTLNKSSALFKTYGRFFRSDLAGISGFNRFHLHRDPFYEDRVREYTEPKKPSITVSVTGAAGQIGYALLFRLASGQVFGPHQPIYINAIELPAGMERLEGLKMELDDCAFPLLKGIKMTSKYEEGFDSTDYCFLVGSKPRGIGMERSDLVKENGVLFKDIGKALNKFAKITCKVLVVGNPANTNAMICALNAPNIPARNFTSMMRLDHDRGVSLSARKLGQDPHFITEFCVWGNHSAKMFPDLTYTRVYGEIYRQSFGSIEFDQWNEEEFIPKVQNRGAEVIKKRGMSSAASAANASINQMRDWVYGTPSSGNWVSMGVPSEKNYGVPDGLWFSFPLDLDPGKDYRVVKDLPLSVFQEKMIKQSVEELERERDAVRHML